MLILQALPPTPPTLSAPPSILVGSTSSGMTLEQALRRARSENPMILAARARVQERQALITTVGADAWPMLNFVADATRVRDVSILNSNIGEMTSKMGIQVNDLVKPIKVQTTNLTVTQPLYYFGKITTAVEIAEMGEKEAQAAYESAELDILHSVAKAYIGVLAAQAELEVIQTRKATAEKFLLDVQNRLDVQAATELDRLRAEAELLAVVPEALQAEANLNRAKENLNGALGLDPKSPLELTALGTPLEPAGAPFEASRRSEMRQLALQQDMLKANDKILKSDLLPKLDFSGSYGFQTGKVSNQFKEPYDAWRVSVTLKVPVFDGFRASGKRAQNRAQLEQVKQATRDIERRILVDRSTAEREYLKAKAMAEAAEKAHKAGAEAMRVSRESYEQGLISSLDLLQAERAERQMESQRRKADLGVWAAIFDLKRTLGQPPL